MSSKFNEIEYSIRKVKRDDFSAINTLLERYFHPEETILKCLLSLESIEASRWQQINTDQRNIIQAMLQNHPCDVVVHNESKKIVAVNIMIVSENPSSPPSQEPIVDVYQTHAPKDRLMVDYFRYMNDMIEQAEIFTKFSEAKRALEFYAVAVDANHRRKGLSTALMSQGLEYAKKNEIDVVFGLFTSPYSKRAAEKIGLKNIFQLDLLEYSPVGEENRGLFKNSVPHNYASIMAIST
ncbi:dopamine N-acetyltransferase [Trichogramma pretiosum]|uniref:dopamine N-acetyltransferase n=1 Tax=Trichogramma pretiosum TaxID=7493 RepID=UPI0006C94CFB|nr:dopamine N-acetyltransferase [Trichogramma pretiosum]